jgi:aminopeptidase
MPHDHESRLRVCAEVIVRIGLNLQPGQRLLIAEPYELQGVCPDAAELVEAVSATAMSAGSPRPEVIWGDAPRLRQYAEQADWTGFARLVAAQARHMKRHLDKGGAFLFPISSFPRLMEGVAAENVSELRRMAWEHFGPIVQRLTGGETQWTLVPAPSPVWAETAFADLAPTLRLDALHETVFSAMRIPAAEAPDSSQGISPPTASALAAWQTHLDALRLQRETLNERRYQSIRYEGPGTDLTVKLPGQHQWCTAQLTTKGGITHVANLPTEEVFTSPDRGSAEGTVRVSRPVNFSGAVIEGIELEFHRGRVIRARARTGLDLLQRLLDTDDGSCRLGEVAMIGTDSLRAASQNADVPAPPARPDASLADWQDSGRLFYHTLLDENASNHIALGESYPFCNRSLFPFRLNRSLVHVDLPLDAHATLA